MLYLRYGKIKLPKLKEVKAKLHRNFSGQIKSATVSQVSSGKYYVSILVETGHKVSHEVISENQVIVSESLQIKNMIKNHHLSKAISNISWYELTRQLEYKAKWNGGKYIKIDTNMFCLWVSEFGYKRFVSEDMDMSEMWSGT